MMMRIRSNAKADLPQPTIIDAVSLFKHPNLANAMNSPGEGWH